MLAALWGHTLAQQCFELIAIISMLKLSQRQCKILIVFSSSAASTQKMLPFVVALIYYLFISDRNSEFHMVGLHTLFPQQNSTSLHIKISPLMQIQPKAYSITCIQQHIGSMSERLGHQYWNAALLFEYRANFVMCPCGLHSCLIRSSKVTGLQFSIPPHQFPLCIVHREYASALLSWCTWANVSFWLLGSYC